jgi:hypothetical protein
MQTVTIRLGTLPPEVAKAVVSAFIGFVLPWLTAVVIQKKWNKRTQTVMAAVVSFGAAFAQCAMSGQLSLADLAASFAVIWPVSQVIYAHVATNLGVWTVEEKTNFDKDVTPDDFPPPPVRPTIMPKNDTPDESLLPSRGSSIQQQVTISPELAQQLLNLNKFIASSGVLNVGKKEEETSERNTD